MQSLTRHSEISRFQLIFPDDGLSLSCFVQSFNTKKVWTTHLLIVNIHLMSQGTSAGQQTPSVPNTTWVSKRCTISPHLSLCFFDMALVLHPHHIWLSQTSLSQRKSSGPQNILVCFCCCCKQLSHPWNFFSLLENNEKGQWPLGCFIKLKATVERGLVPYAGMGTEFVVEPVCRTWLLPQTVSTLLMEEIGGNGFTHIF